MAGRKPKGIPDFNSEEFSSVGGKDRFGQIHLSMIASDTYKGLSLGAMHLMDVCLVHIKTPNNYHALSAYCEEEGKDYKMGHGYFILASSQLAFYGISDKSAYRWFKELNAAGFIECIENNRHRHRPNVYRLSKEWKR